MGESKRIMGKHDSSWFIDHNYAAMWIPIRLLISIAIITFFIGLVVIGSQLATETIQQNTLKTRLSEIKHGMETLYQHGDSRNLGEFSDTTGSKRVFSLTVPDCVSSVYFGKKRSEINDLKSSIRYFAQRETEIVWLDSEIQLVSGKKINNLWQRNENNTGFQMKSGTYSFTAELVCNNTMQFILIYPVN